MFIDEFYYYIITHYLKPYLWFSKWKSKSILLHKSCVTIYIGHIRHSCFIEEISSYKGIWTKIKFLNIDRMSPCNMKMIVVFLNEYCCTAQEKFVYQYQQAKITVVYLEIATNVYNWKSFFLDMWSSCMTASVYMCVSEIHRFY